MNNRVSHIVTLACVAVISGCAGSSHSLPAAPATQNAAAARQAFAGVVHGNFTEYSVPGNPVDFTKGPYNTLWWDANIPAEDNGFNMYRFAEGTGVVTTFSKGPPAAVATTPLTLQGGRIYLVSLNTDPTRPADDEEFLSNFNFSGVFTNGPLVATQQALGPLALGPDGNVWFPICVESCGFSTDGDFITAVTYAGGRVVGVQLPQFTPNVVTAGPGGLAYATASFTNALPPPPPPTVDSAVFVISPTPGFGSILNKVALPHASLPWGIVVGSDKNLWIAEPGVNEIARMTPAGSVTQFPLPTANAGAKWLTPGADTAVWFTETNANKIGRITPAGSITEFPIPTANSKPNGIHYCTTNCPPRGGVWFVETGASKIGKFNSPL